MSDLEATDQRDGIEHSQGLSWLIGPVATLQTENSQLKVQIQRLQDQVIVLKSDALALDNGTRFPRFSALPVEIRSIIWRHGCEKQHIHILSLKMAKRSHLDNVFNSCKEATQAVLSLRFNSFQQGKEKTCVLFNGAIDTVFLQDGVAPDYVKWSCGLCVPCSSCGHCPPVSSCTHTSGVWPEGWHGIYNQMDHDSPKVLRSLALSFEDISLTGPPTRKYTFKFLHRYQVEELFVVMETIKVPGRLERGISFVKPPRTPKQWIDEESSRYGEDTSHKKSWDNHPDLLDDFIEYQGWPEEEKRLFEIFKKSGEPCYSDFKAPKVKYVFAISR